MVSVAAPYVIPKVFLMPVVCRLKGATRIHQWNHLAFVLVVRVASKAQTWDISRVARNMPTGMIEHAVGKWMKHVTARPLAHGGQ